MRGRRNPLRLFSLGGLSECARFVRLTGSERRKTVAVPIDGLFYEVGPEVNLAADTFRATQMHDRYTETPEYAALLRGALSLMKVGTIDLLVVGLPVAAFTAKKAALEKE